MWYLIVSIPDLCTLTYFDCFGCASHWLWIKVLGWLCFVVHYFVLSSFAIILKRKRELVDLLLLSYDLVTVDVL